MLFALLIACGAPLDRAANPDDSDYPELATLDAQILDEMELARLPGLSACIIKDGAVAWCQGYGLADIDEKRTVSPQTPFLVASVSKAVAGMALVHAAENGTLGLDDPINDHLGFSVVHPAQATPITGRMLSAHAAGIEDNWGAMESLYTDGDPAITLGDFMEGYLTPSGDYYSARRNFTRSGPGIETAYSNVGTALMGHLIEAAAGQDFSEYCTAYLFTPLGLTHTGWFLSALDQDTLAVPYEIRWGRYKAVEHYGFPDYPSGQLRSSAEDMARLLLVVMGGGTVDGVSILSEESVAELLTVQYPDLDGDQGASWYRWRLGGETVWGHNGGEIGASAELLFWPEEDLGAVILTNGEADELSLAWIEKRMREAAASL